MITKLNLENLQRIQGKRTGNPNMCCVPKCKNLMVFDSPDYLCPHHWAQWWADDCGIEAEEEYEKEYRFILSV